MLLSHAIDGATPGNTITSWKSKLATGHTVIWLRTVIVLWAIFIVVLALFFVDNPYILAGIILYEVLP
jgi:hypothetical protein